MKVYYNENDPKTAAWLKQLIADGHLPAGDVDERSIEDVQGCDLDGYTACHFFAGIGGWAYALQLAGWPDDRPVWTGSAPCQPFTSAGNGKGTKDHRDLWPVFFRLISHGRPATIFGEQSHRAITHGWLDRLCDDLEENDYAVGAAVLPACCVGAGHERQRLWWVADAGEVRQSWAPAPQPNHHAQRDISTPQQAGVAVVRPARAGVQFSWPPGPGRVHEIPLMDDGPSAGMVGISGAGNAIVAPLAAEFVAAYLEVTSSPRESPAREEREVECP